MLEDEEVEQVEAQIEADQNEVPDEGLAAMNPWNAVASQWDRNSSTLTRLGNQSVFQILAGRKEQEVQQERQMQRVEQRPGGGGGVEPPHARVNRTANGGPNPGSFGRSCGSGF